MKMPGIKFAMARSQLLDGGLPGAPIPEMIQRSFHPARSGHIHLASHTVRRVAQLAAILQKSVHRQETCRETNWLAHGKAAGGP